MFQAVAKSINVALPSCSVWQGSVFLLSAMSLGVGVFSLPTVLNAIGWLWGMGLCCYFGLLSTLLMLNLLDIVT